MKELIMFVTLLATGAMTFILVNKILDSPKYPYRKPNPAAFRLNRGRITDIIFNPNK